MSRGNVVGWLSGKIQNWSKRIIRREMDEFVGRLRALDASELGMIVACAADQRHRLERFFPINLLAPSATIVSVPEAPVELRKLIAAAQHRGDFVAAAGLMVWLHTLRAMLDIDLRQGGRDMWRELARGFPHCEDAAHGVFDLTGMIYEIAGYDLFPDGLSPTPRN